MSTALFQQRQQLKELNAKDTLKGDWNRPTRKPKRLPLVSESAQIKRNSEHEVV